MHDFLLPLLNNYVTISLSFCSYLYVHFCFTKFIIISTLYLPESALFCIFGLFGMQFLINSLAINISYNLPLFPPSNQYVKQKGSSFSTLTFPVFNLHQQKKKSSNTKHLITENSVFLSLICSHTNTLPSTHYLFLSVNY